MSVKVRETIFRSSEALRWVVRWATHCWYRANRFSLSLILMAVRMASVWMVLAVMMQTRLKVMDLAAPSMKD